MADMQVRKDFEKFRDECTGLSKTYNMYRDLRENGAETEKILQDSARAFFEQLNEVLIDRFFLQVCRLTDPDRTGSKVNLTSQYIDEQLHRHCLMTPEIMKHSRALLRYRKVLQRARNQLIAHLDRTTILGTKALGAHGENDAIDFLQSLQEYCDAVGTAIGAGPSSFLGIGEPGDAIDLLKVLERGLECGKQAQGH